MHGSSTGEYPGQELGKVINLEVLGNYLSQEQNHQETNCENLQAQLAFHSIGHLARGFHRRMYRICNKNGSRKPKRKLGSRIEWLLRQVQDNRIYKQAGTVILTISRVIKAMPRFN